ncbi:phosphonate C-P lyase system protein PhnL [Desulfobacula phenolica]|uniref:Alpha-D-ribose 1-methylphosphonate 5-triphosphate synthase subunit PhnL n=1 Tax=Desulfobacula phenolica TaxID=90732 RepID=A0A1H2H2G4_9BACT|nr:phosphonate C-P lyase system protein PhnL [Desulfobacula phenolica]SDU26016.1 alpha-D-ribose 1-methylphosphonate 5-triphosphate synthase subunit PhnL [Desulfobacula phenolica]
MEWVLKLIDIGKDFVFHHQHGTRLVVLDNFSMDFFPGETAILSGPSGSGKSTLLRMIYAGYKTGKGKILIKHNNQQVDIAAASPSIIYSIRQNTIGYVSQFLRIVPRVSALDTVIEPLIARNISESIARKTGKQMLDRLNIPQSLWHLSAATFSGGEQQRINIARGFIAPYPILLLDEPTASLDARNRQVVIELIQEAIGNSTCVLAIFHDKSDQKTIADRIIDMSAKSFQEI